MRVMKLILIFRGSDWKWLYHGPKWQSLKKHHKMDVLKCFRNTNMAIMTNSYNFGGSKSDQIGSAFGLDQSWTPRCQEVPPTASHWRSPWRSHGAACHLCHGKSRIKRNYRNSDHSHPVVLRCPKMSKACRCFFNSSCFSHPATASMCLIRAANLNGSSWAKATGEPSAK